MCMFFNELKQNTDASADSTKSTSVLPQSTKCMRGSLHMNTLANTYKKECLSSLNLKGPAFSQDLEILVRSDEIPTVI